MINKPSCLHDWSPKEFESLQRDLDRLRIIQPKPEVKIARTGIKGCHYHKLQGVYIVNLIKNGKKIYAGRMKEWNRKEALELQAKAESKWIEQQKTISQEIN